MVRAINFKINGFHAQTCESTEKKDDTSQLDYNIGPMRRHDEVYIHNGVRTWATWDHLPTCARIHDEKQTNFPKGKRKKKWTGWKPNTDEQTIELRKEMMDKNDDNSDEDLV